MSNIDISKLRLGITGVLKRIVIYLPYDDGSIDIEKEISEDEFDFIATELGYIKNKKEN